MPSLNFQAQLLLLYRAIHPRRSKRGENLPAAPLTKAQDLAHTLYERFVLALPTHLMPPSPIPSLGALLVIVYNLISELKTYKANTSTALPPSGLPTPKFQGF